MSRLRRFTQSLASGYFFLGVNILFTLGSVPIALHYLSKEAFGLWALVSQIAGYLTLIDLGMSGSISRILMDHKDDVAGGVYGAIIKTGMAVLAVEGVMIVIGGAVISVFLPDLFAVPPEYRRDFQLLVAGQCALMGLLLAGRIYIHVLIAHSRFDVTNLVSAGGLVVNLGVMWLTMWMGWGLYSLLAGAGVSALVMTFWTWGAAARLKLLPPKGAWGRSSMKVFWELFAFAQELFLLPIGWQLVNASQVIVISRTLGLEAAATWAIATKAFTLAQQVVYRIYDFSSVTLAEMFVRGEHETLQRRFGQVVSLTAAFAVWVGLGAGLCNHDFLFFWTKGRVQWGLSSDWLMAILVISYATTRCGVGFVAVNKQIGGMKYVYPIEGLGFIVLSFLTAPKFGLNAVILSALGMNLLCSGAYGLWRAKGFFRMAKWGSVLEWLRRAAVLLVCLGAVCGILWWAGRTWDPRLRLVMFALLSGITGAALFWAVGLDPELRQQGRMMAGKVISRLRPAGAPLPSGTKPD